MKPFVYPKVRHTRAYAPKQYGRYQTYKRWLRAEFERKCVYCRMPDTLLGYSSFGVDHYKPQVPYAHLATTYSNLFYCCNSCNSNKNSYWPDPAVEATEFIPNPCDHVMFDHLRFNKEVVEHKTKAGEITKKLLDLNDPVVVGYRKAMIATLTMWQDKELELQGLKAAVQKKVKSGAMQPGIGAVAIAELDAELVVVADNIAIFSGGAKAPTKAKAAPATKAAP